MVAWMQRVDASRSELRELNDLSFARFDARLGERLAQTEGHIVALEARMDARGAQPTAEIERQGE